MELTKVVARHRFEPSDLGEVKDAKLYHRHLGDGVTEILCVQKIGNVFRVDRFPMLVTKMMGQSLVVPVGEPVSNKIVERDELENYLNTTLRL